jgi:hypothetical protein
MLKWIAQNPNVTMLIAGAIGIVAYTGLIRALKKGSKWPFVLRRIFMVGS